MCQPTQYDIDTDTQRHARSVCSHVVERDRGESRSLRAREKNGILFEKQGDRVNRYKSNYKGRVRVGMSDVD